MYTFLGSFYGLGEWLTPHGKQLWQVCKTRKPFTCVKSGKWHPAHSFAWRPLGNPKNRHERISTDFGLDTRSLATIVTGHPQQQRLVKELIRWEKPMPMHRLSHYARLSYRRIKWAFEALNREGLLRVTDEWGSTSDWYQSDGTEHESYVIYFNG